MAELNIASDVEFMCVKVPLRYRHEYGLHKYHHSECADDIGCCCCESNKTKYHYAFAGGCMVISGSTIINNNSNNNKHRTQNTKKGCTNEQTQVESVCIHGDFGIGKPDDAQFATKMTYIRSHIKLAP